VVFHPIRPTAFSPTTRSEEGRSNAELSRVRQVPTRPLPDPRRELQGVARDGVEAAAVDELAELPERADPQLRALAALAPEAPSPRHPAVRSGSGRSSGWVDPAACAGVPQRHTAPP